MNKYIKSYGVFLTGTIIKIVLLVIYPVVALCWGSLFAFTNTKFAIVGLSAVAAGIIIGELFLDYFVYGGILSKDTNKLEYLKTSCKGMEILRQSLVIDKLRRMLVITGMLSVTYLIGNDGVNIAQFVSFVLGTVMVVEASLLISRHLDNLSFVLVVMMVANLLGLIILVGAAFLPGICVILFVAGFIGVEIGSNRLIMKRVKGSYHDVKVE